MSSYMGISYDKWHGILSALVINMVFFILWMLFKSFFIPYVGPAFTAILFWGFGVWVAHWLQCWNEINQALDPSVSFKYGSWRNFVRNSRRDFRYFWRGVMFSWVGVGILILFI